MLKILLLLWADASILEIAWTIIGSVGTGFNGLGWRDARGDLKELKRRKVNGGARRLVLIRARWEGISAYIQFLCVLLGIVAMFTPPRNTPWTFSAIVTSIVLMSIEIALMYNSVKTRYDREEVIEEEASRLSRADELALQSEASVKVAENTLRLAEESRIAAVEAHLNLAAAIRELGNVISTLHLRSEGSSQV